MLINDIQQISVVGAGLMGHGIALEFALAGYRVSLNDLTDEMLQAGMEQIRESLRLLQEWGRVEAGQAENALANISAGAELEAGASEADVVIEAIAENLEQKLVLFGQLDALCPSHTVLASNSSSFMPSQMATATKRPEQVVGTHYFNPPFLIPLVEIIRGERTSDDTVDVLHGLLTTIGKSPVVVEKEVPGFIANRIQAAVWREILWLVADGVATPQDVDRVVKTSIGRRWAAAGPFEVTELAGLDLKQEILKELLPSLASGAEVPPILREKVARGELGTKAGKGFYEWTAEGARDLRERIARALVEIERWE